MSSYATAVLCGDLNMLRCFARSGIDTIAVCTSPNDVTFRSRYCQSGAVITSPTLDPQTAVGDLIQLGKDIGHKSILFYGDDATLRLVSRNRGALRKYFDFLMPSDDDIERMVDKALFAEMCRGYDLPVPQTLLSSQVNSAADALTRVQLPAVFKPNSHIGWFRSQFIMEEGGSPQKAVRADNTEEFHRVFDKLKEHNVDFIMQQYIPGGDDCIFSFHTYFNAESKPLGYYVGRKIRTYPKGSGLSTYIRLVHDDDVVRVGLDILRKLNFVGVAKIDFKKDPRTNQLYMLEINPRFNLWNYLGTACGVNLPLIAYRDITGQSVAPQFNWRTNLCWLSFLDDLRAVVRDYRRDGDITILKWLRSLMTPKVHDIFAWSDPWPFVVSLSRMIRLYGRKYLLHKKDPVQYMRKGVAK